MFLLYCSIPTVTSKQYAILVARDMVKSLQKITDPKYMKLNDQNKSALFKLAKIFNEALPNTNKKLYLDYVNELLQK